MTVNEILTGALKGKHVRILVDGEKDRELVVRDVVLDIDGMLVVYDETDSFVRVNLAAVQAFELIKPASKASAKEPKDGDKVSGKK